MWDDNSRIDTDYLKRLYQADPQLGNAMPECIAIIPVTKREIVVVQPETKKERAKVRVQKIIKEVAGPNGPEPSFQIAYNYQPINGGSQQIDQLEAAHNQRYKGASSDKRPGNRHTYVIEVPKSLAEAFKAALIAHGPAVARALGDKIVQEYAPDDYKQRWNAEKAQEAAGKIPDHRFYPTYNSLPPQVPTHLFDGTGTTGEVYGSLIASYPLSGQDLADAVPPRRTQNPAHLLQHFAIGRSGGILKPEADSGQG